jgi:hypothetical protein
MPATYDDANLVVQLVRWGAETGIDEAASELFADGFDPETAKMDDAPVRKMLQFGEVIGTLVKQGVLDRGLVLDLWWVKGAWARVQPTAQRERTRLGEARLYENFEALAESAGS